MHSLEYLHLDVFTRHRFEGNQLAVFPNPDALSTEQMQKIAQEMNFSESTFIYPARSGGDVQMRIFTPGNELPIAGHPTIGTTFALAHLGTIARGRTDWVYELGVGPTPVSLEWKDAALSFAWMTMPLPSFGGEIDNRDALAAACGISPADLHEAAPVQEVSCGVPFLYLPLKTRTAVDAVAIDRIALARCCREAGLPELAVYMFAPERDGDATVYSRMLAPGFGISEDPATGSACGPLGCYLLYHALVSAERAKSMVSFQGAAMGRPSRIHMSIDSEDEMITRVRVGGEAVLVGRGVLERPL
jgi:trans-2,3-dihydro-3-hydroxyanthranilate isomerase